MRLPRVGLIALSVSFFPVVSWAGGTAVIEFGSGNDSMQSQIEFDGNILRMGLPGEAESYMLVRDERFFSVTHQGGQPIVMDMGQMLSQLGGMMGDMMGEQPTDVTGEINTLVSLESLGRNETIAGIDGEVYSVTYTDGEGASRTTEIVLGQDDRLNELTRAMQSWGQTMARILDTPSNDETMDELLEEGDGILRFGDDYRLVSVDGNTPAASRFELPAEPQQIPGFGGMSFGQGDATGQSSVSNPVEAQAERQAERQQQRVEGRAQNEIDSAADRAVDRAVDSVFSGIFGR